MRSTLDHHTVICVARATAVAATSIVNPWPSHGKMCCWSGVTVYSCCQGTHTVSAELKMLMLTYFCQHDGADANLLLSTHDADANLLLSTRWCWKGIQRVFRAFLGPAILGLSHPCSEVNEYNMREWGKSPSLALFPHPFPSSSLVLFSLSLFLPCPLFPFPLPPLPSSSLTFCPSLPSPSLNSLPYFLLPSFPFPSFFPYFISLLCIFKFFLPPSLFPPPWSTVFRPSPIVSSSFWIFLPTSHSYSLTLLHTTHF